MPQRETVMNDLGEKAFLQGLLPQLTVDPRFVNGFGHDASVIDIGLPDINLVMKIDRAAKPIAALNDWSDYRVWGRLAVTANCSDILATGGHPTAFMLSVSVTGDTSADIVREIVAGAGEECAARKVAFLGGDTKEAASSNIIGAALGIIPKARHFDRRLGKVGDLLVLAGELGGFLGGYWNCRTAISPPANAVEYLSHPRASWLEAEALATLAGVRSACDLSDGLASSAMNLAEVGAGVLLDFAALPFHGLALGSACEREVDILPYAFGVGDWGILYAADPAIRPSVDNLRAAGLSIAVVGEIVDQPGLFLRRGDTFRLSVPENEHFRHRMEDEGDYFAAHERGLALSPLTGSASLFSPRQ